MSKNSSKSLAVDLGKIGELTGSASSMLRVGAALCFNLDLADWPARSLSLRDLASLMETASGMAGEAHELAMIRASTAQRMPSQE